MNERSIVDTSRISGRRGVKGRPKGRSVDPQALADVRALLGDAPRERVAADRAPAPDPGCAGLPSARAPGRAGAGDEARDHRGLRGGNVLSPFRRPRRRRNAASAGHDPRVRDAVVPDGRGGRTARRPARRRRCGRARPQGALHRALRARACRRRRAPARRRSDGRKGDGCRRCREHRTRAPRLRRSCRLPRCRRLSHARGLRHRGAQRRRRDQGARELRAAGPRRRRIPGRAQVAHRARRARPAADGRQYRRGRAGDVQGPALPRTRPPPLPRGHADRRVGGRHRRYLCLPAGRIRGLPRAAGTRARRARKPILPAHCRASSCAAAPAPTSAARNRR